MLSVHRELNTRIINDSYDGMSFVTAENNAFNNLKSGKSVGTLALSTDHFIHACDQLIHNNKRCIERHVSLSESESLIAVTRQVRMLW